MNSAIISAKLSTSEQFLSLSDAAGLVLLMALPHCDDYGRIKASPQYWVLKVCPGRKTLADIKGILKEILANVDDKGESMLTPYTVNGEDFFYVTNWFRYQGLRHDYIANAMCPHPVAGVREPPVKGQTLKKTFDSKMEAYNRLTTEVTNFLENPPGKTGAKPGDSPTDLRENGDNPREFDGDPRKIPWDDPENPGATRRNGQKSRVFEPPPASSPALASSSSPALASPPASAAREPHGAEGSLALGPEPDPIGQHPPSSNGNAPPYATPPVAATVGRGARGKAR